jgi:hypothetical protein
MARWAPCYEFGPLAGFLRAAQTGCPARRQVGPSRPSHARAVTALWGRVVSGGVCSLARFTFGN